MKKISALFFIFISILSFSQDVLEKYPEGQDAYNGGVLQLYKEINQILIAKNLKPCENKSEYYALHVLVFPDNSIKYVKDENPDNATKNKCSFDLAREVAKYLHGWQAATVDHKKVIAQTSYYIIPSQLFGNYTEGYYPFRDFTEASYEGGMNKFRKKVFQNIDLSRFTFDGTFRLVVTFTVEADGKMSNVLLAESSGLQEFDDMVIKSIKSIRNKWTPAKSQDVPIASKFRLPLVFQTN
ncbi:TonB family C-terminal domain-containing protein [Halpernia humi]|uniref:TonB family C-terminal domain-containing protein n=1 Tax=Halpernia humi TaxID=493375 RepID=A0A1H5WRV8_9FLAO|nr:energy transducer TonB [Halpernia humi]SEG02319.1 TonB family C-terminal domain-containing protein [Halpernia humi]